MNAYQIAIRQIERWIIASQQDVNPGIKLLHANYAVGDLDMLRQMYNDKFILSMTGQNPHSLLIAATALQDKAQAEIKEICPELFERG